MSVELMKKQVQLNESSEQEMVQIVKERDLIVPDGNPDMQRVMYLDGKIKIDQMDVQEGRVVYKGQIEVTVLYVPENNPNTVCRMKGSIPLEDFIIIEGVDPSKKVSMDYEIEHLHWAILNERKLNVKAIVQIMVDVMGSKDVNLVTDAYGGESPIQMQSKQMQAIKPMHSGYETEILKDELTIPQNKCSMGELLNVHAMVKEEQVKRTEDELIYSGMVEVCIMYKGQGEHEKIEVVRHCIPFNSSVPLPKSDYEMYWDYDLSVEPTYTQIGPDYDGEDRILELECMLTIKYATYDKLEETVIDDIYCPGKKVNMVEHTEHYTTLSGKTNVKAPKKEMVSMEGFMGDLDEIFSLELKPMIDEQEIEGDKLTINGMVETKIVYTSPDDMNQIQSTVEVVPFSEQIQVPGMNEDSTVNINLKPKHATMNTYNKNDMMLEYVMEYLVDAYNEEEVKVVEEVEVTEMPVEEMNQCPSITVYVVKKGDTLWNLAKKYNTTVQDIMEINDIDSNALIYPGQKLIILKKTKF